MTSFLMLNYNYVRYKIIYYGYITLEMTRSCNNRLYFIDFNISETLQPVEYLNTVILLIVFSPLHLVFAEIG